MRFTCATFRKQTPPCAKLFSCLKDTDGIAFSRLSPWRKDGSLTPEAEAKTPKRLKHVAAKFYGRSTSPATPIKVARKRGADVATSTRWKIVSAYNKIAKGSSRLPPGGMKELLDKFPGQNLSERVMQNIVC